ncbi:MAG: M24 family metallopeptidase C-terminal domain-containing protein [Synergistaceae bacterium]|nr:M24 family metallopeptidase C-terminal domain-containing protein [Synergistaceae bacterium]
MSLLTKDEISWLNSYNELIRKTLLPMLDGELATFVMAETEPFNNSSC